MKLSDLHPNPFNPRKITDEKLKMLNASIDTFGDLSGIVFNKASMQIVSAHQRLRCLPKDATITITKTYEKPTKRGTIKEGYVVIDEERFSYREVDWDPITEKAANIAANQQGGDFDTPRLADMILEIESNNYPIELLGFDKEELENIMAPIGEYPSNIDDLHQKICPKCGEKI